VLPIVLLVVASAAALAPAPLAAETAKAPSAPAFVSGDWLEKLLPPEVVLIDARPMRDFLASHIPGAQNVTPENLRASAGGVPASLYPPEVLDAVFARIGIEATGHVVVYGNESDVDATYVATAARIAGAACVSVLDGGFSRWKGEGRPVTAERPVVPQVRRPFRGNASLLVPVAEVLTRVGDGKTVFLDVRTEEQWSAGRIPGAKNRPWKKDVADGSFRPPEEIRAEMEAAGVSWEKPVVVYCNSGHQASEGFYMLKYKLGHPDVRLYQGSWLEWSMTPGTPKESSALAEPAPR
jgi:thiosulfate/3-mercaptopyruvate sulfurtransferase